ncbi:hypothetical protein KEJ45_06115 [Candidatus Bathyarchaeota archaeon]|nr:hypothetical protein [Candidatus Bathyarchaeota archaeon]
MEKVEEMASKGLSDEDLGLALVDCLLIDKPRESRSLDALVFEVEYRDERYRVGVIGEDALESVKKHGYKDNQGKIHLRIPMSKLKKPIGWINEAY